jgi:hypothetical protein
LLVLKIEDVELLYRYFPQPDEMSDEVTLFMQQHPETAAARDKLHSFKPSEPKIFTDYVIVVEWRLAQDRTGTREQLSQRPRAGSTTAWPLEAPPLDARSGLDAAPANRGSGQRCALGACLASPGLS